MRKLVFLLFCLPLFGKAQQFQTFNQERYDLDKKLMLTLTGWSATNALIGAYGWASTNDEAKYFHQMNTLWSGVNLALAVPGYLKARKGNVALSFSETYSAQTKTEKVFLFNTALDFTYITAGFYLKQCALTDQSNYHRFRGWGNSLILQGGFLLLFDLTATVLHTKHRKQKLDAFLDHVELSDNGVGVKYTF